jgi:hypothetical protein
LFAKIKIECASLLYLLKMRSLIIFTFILVLFFISGCSIIGAELDKDFNRDTVHPHKYESWYFFEGLETDIEILRAILTQPENEAPITVPNPCKSKGTFQVCSVKKGCWCEEQNR